LIHFGEKNLNEAIQNSIHRINRLADQLYLSSPSLTKLRLINGAIKNSLKNFCKTWFVRKGIREGFEGLVFCFLDSVVIVLGYLKYYEKYIRSGRQIADNSASIKKILVIKLRGLGDAVLATPVLKNIKYFMPNVSISVLTFNFCKPLFENNPNVNSLYGLSEKPKASELKKIANILSAHDFDLIINLHARNLSSRLAKNIKARWRINGSYFIREKFTDVLIGSDHELDKSSIEKDLDCIRAIGLEPFEKQPELFVTDEEFKWANGYLAEKGLDRGKKIIMVHPAVTQPYRHWGMDKFIELSRKLTQDGKFQVMGIFSEMEQSIANILLENVKDVFVYVGPMRPSMALIQQANLMIDNDSGPAHVAQALNVPTLVLVGPDYKNSYRDSQIYGNKHYVFYKDIPCRDLFFSGCLPPNPCLKYDCIDHSVEEVFQKAQKLLIQ
jgi:ADP-heptose:LPS heptosyltransferase